MEKQKRFSFEKQELSLNSQVPVTDIQYLNAN